MKTVLQTLLLLGFITMNAQIGPILDHNWTLEKVVIDDETIMAEPNPNPNYDNYPMINFNHGVFNGIPYSSFDFVDFHPSIIFNDENSAFSIDEMMLDFGTYHETAAANAFRHQFIYIDDNQDFEHYVTFTYNFSQVGDLIYLEITNPVDDTATFWASTLSNEKFDITRVSLYPNPVTNQLHIETDQAKIERIEIYTIGGKKVLDVNFLNDQPIDVSKLIRGLYLVKVETGNGSLTKKLVKK